jgi:AAA15 family ATPase/GTPase
MLNDTTRLDDSFAGFLMAKSVDIQNFRGFDSVYVPDCKRINIVVGDNGSGKTAFMEAVFLASSLSPEIALRFRAFRGYENTVAGQARDIERAMWGDLFHDHNFAKGIYVRLSGSRAQERILTVTYNERNRTMTRSKKSQDVGWNPVNFVWKGANNSILHTSTPGFADGKLTIPPSPPPLYDSAFFAANHTYPPGDMVNRFSALSIESDETALVENFKDQFELIENLSIEMNAGSPLLYAKLQDKSEKLPLALISGGMNKLASILFTMSRYKEGIILIDEIENGFYYKKMPLIWRSILHFAEFYDVQVFASTHSIECLQAVEEIAEENPTKFSVIQAGNGRLHQFTGARFIDAMEQNIEIR